MQEEEREAEHDPRPERPDAQRPAQREADDRERGGEQREQEERRAMRDLVEDLPVWVWGSPPGSSARREW